MASARIQGLTMPKWGLSMNRGKVVQWLVSEGSSVTAEMDIVEVESEKITGAVPTPAAGILRRLVASPGDDLPVGALLGVIADAETDDATIDSFVEEAATTVEIDETEITTVAPESVLLGDRKIRYLRRGDGSPTIVLIHGFGGNLNNWLFNHEVLAEERTVYSVELPGHGQSSKDVGDGSLDTMVQVILDWFSAVSLNEAHVVGHSLGGAIATQLARQAPEKVQSCTLIASAGLGADINGDFLNGMIQTSRRKQLKPQLEKLFADPGLVTRQLVDDMLKFKRLDGVEQALQTIADQMMDPEGNQAHHVREQLGGLNVPVQVLWGEDDQIIPASHATGLSGESLVVRVLPGYGHMVHMEAAADVNRAIAEIAS